MKPKMKDRGFTLIELLVVISIIGLMSGIVIVPVNSARAKARDVKRIAEIRELMIALELYHDSNGHYPASIDCDQCASGSWSPNNFWCNSVESLSDGHWICDWDVENVLSPFMSVEPTDPRPGSSPIGRH